jgi:hypothetical protein
LKELVLLLMPLVLLLLPTPALAASDCGGRPATIVGTSGDDWDHPIYGTLVTS